MTDIDPSRIVKYLEHYARIHDIKDVNELAEHAVKKFGISRGLAEILADAALTSIYGIKNLIIRPPYSGRLPSPQATLKMIEVSRMLREVQRYAESNGITKVDDLADYMEKTYGVSRDKAVRYAEHVLGRIASKKKFANLL